jgi:DNA-binding NtrC family response regulator
VILVVDDEPFVLNSVAAVLQYAGYGVLRASSGREALRLAAGHSPPIHLLLTDVRLPVTSGPRLATQFAALHPETRCLFMAGLPDHPDLPESARQEKKALLAKPFTAKVLLEAVRQALAPTARTA